LDQAGPAYGFSRADINVVAASVDASGSLQVIEQGEPATLTTRQLSPQGRLVTSGAATLAGATLETFSKFDTSGFLLTGRAETDFPLSAGAFQNGDTFVAIARPSDGAIVYSTRLPYRAAPNVLTPNSTMVAPDGSGGFLLLHRSQYPWNSTWLLTRFVPVEQPKAAVFAISNEAESDVSASLAPGEVVSITGDGIGPAQPVAGTFDGGRLPFLLGGVQVLFNGTPGPIVSVSSQQVTAVAPFAISGAHAVTVDVQVNGRSANPLYVPGSDAEPQIVHNPPDSLGQLFAAALNEDGTLNCSGGLAAPGSVMTIFLNGAGLLTPLPDDGTLGQVGQQPALPIFPWFKHHHMENVPVDILYAGAAPGLLAGVMQVNFRLPPYGPPAGPGQITVGVGGHLTQTMNICVAPQ
jgi:uncharacterized protein (TIGR03437 family)